MYDIEQIKQQFRSVIEYSQEIDCPMVDELFKVWGENKKRFIERFGGLIYEWPNPVEFTLDPKIKEIKVHEFIDCVCNVFGNDELAEFLGLNFDSFFDNIVSTSKNKNIPTGMKLIKAFKFFEKNKQALRDMQDIASQLIQENRVVGTLCFSVHPLDFLSSSENTYNWRSCHALDGEYRAGNLSYMCDKTTFMVYLRGADGVRINAFPDTVKWNSKKWRMLIHATESDEIMFAGRQYPFSSKGGIDTVLNVYNNLLQSKDREMPWYLRSYNKYDRWQADYINGYTPYDCDKTADTPYEIELDDKYIVFGNRLISLDEAVKKAEYAMNYNDILDSSCYQFPYYAVLNINGWHRPHTLRENPLVIGRKCHCLQCGDNYITDPETMRCNECECEYGHEYNDSYGSCENCGRRIYFDDAYDVNDQYICDNCFTNYCFTCDDCGERHFTYDKHCVEIDEDVVEYYCPRCYENYTDRGE